MWLTPEDLLPLAPGADVTRLGTIIADVEAKAIVAAPCITGIIDGAKLDALVATLRQAALRWHVAGDGETVTRQESAGPMGYSLTTSPAQRGAGRLYDSEVRELRELCGSTARRGRAFSVRPR